MLRYFFMTFVFTVFLGASAVQALSQTMKYLGTWQNTRTYPKGSVTVHNRGIYFSLKGSVDAPNKNYVPSSNASWWEQVGTVGNTLHSGVVNPTAQSLGQVGDYYINTATNTIFGPKTNSGWSASGVSLVGPAGPQGLQGATGPAGPQGFQGATGPAGVQITAREARNGPITLSSTGASFVSSSPSAELTINIGSSGSAVVILYQDLSWVGSYAGHSCAVSFEVNQGNSIVLAASTSRETFAYLQTYPNSSSNSILVTGLAAGQATFTIKYRVPNTSCTWRDSKLIVLPQ